MNRNLDGCYFRVLRDGKWEDICFSDLTLEERDEATKDRSDKWFKALAYHLADIIKDMGDKLNIIGSYDD